MKILKTGGIVILAVVATLMIASVFIPAQVHIERDIVINAPKELIFQQVNNLQNWSHWAPWTPDSIAANPNPGSNNVNPATRKSRITITRSVPFELLEFDIQKKSWLMKSSFKLEELPEGVRAIWSITSEAGKKPFRKYYGLYLRRFTGDKLEKGLMNLKNLSEANARNI